MMKMRTITIAFGLLFLAACQTQQPGEGVEPGTETAPQQDSGMAEPIAGGAETSQLGNEQLTAEELLDQPDSPLATRVFYFDFDSAKVRDEFLPVLEAHGAFLAENGNVRVRLEGHADERGSREYNIGLGDRRAQSVRRILMFQGASSDQIETISYGEERPAVLGHDESAWSKNRRVELVYEVQ
jgi:peptidoglycan-associated lipoprotein